MRISIDKVRIGKRLRAADMDHVYRMAISIQEIGLQTPISVVPGERWEDGRCFECFDLVAGLHRLMACRELNHEMIDVRVVEMAEIDRQLWECDENLARADLTPVAEARFLARRKQLYEIKYPETRKGGDHGNQYSGGRERQNDNLSFSRDTAAKTGESERTIQRAVRRADNIDDEVLSKIEGTEHDKGVVLDNLAKLEPKKQREAVKRLAAGIPVDHTPAQTSTTQLEALLQAWKNARPLVRTLFLQRVGRRRGPS